MRTLAFFAAVAGAAVLASAIVPPATIAAERADQKKAVKVPPKPPPRAAKTPAAKPKTRTVVPAASPSSTKLTTPPGAAPGLAPPGPPAGITAATPGVTVPAEGECGPTQVKIDGRCQCPTTMAWTGQSCVVPLVITTTSPLPPATQGKPYSQSLTASGGKAPYTWSRVGGTWPLGLAFSYTGALLGAPSQSGDFSLMVKVEGPPGLTATKTFTLSIAAPHVVVTTPNPLPLGIQWQSYSQTLTATGGTPPYTWSLVGTPPGWLTLSPTGVLSGTPASTTGTPVTVQVTDTTPGTPLSGTKTFTLSVGSYPLEITTPSPLPPATQGQPYSQSLTASGGKAPYTTWSVVVGSLPSGLTLSPGGVLSGTPTAAVLNQHFLVKVTDSSPGTPLTTTKYFGLTVEAPHVVVTTPSPLPHATVGQLYGQTLTATGGNPPYTWSFFQPPPAWLTLSPTGVLQGTPTGGNANLFNYHPSFMVKVTDSTPGTPLVTYTTFAMPVYAGQ